MKTTEPDHEPKEEASFEREAAVVLHELQPALASIVQHLRPPVRRAAHLRQRLNLSHKVSWSLFNAATADDARVLPSLLPGRRGMEGFFGAAESHGVAPELIERARAAFERFEESAARHASSRDAFETMVAGLGGGGDSGGATLRHKRAAFRANALLVGRHVRVCLATRIMHPSGDEGAAGTASMDAVFINGMIGLQRTRRDVPMHMATRHCRRACAGDATEPAPPAPLDPRETGPDSIGLLRDFCSRPLPEFRLCESRTDFRRYELANSNLGASGEVTYFTGEVLRASSVAPGRIPGSEVTLAKFVSTPMEMYIGDILIHRSAFGQSHPMLPKVQVYATGPDDIMSFRDSDLLPFHERGEYLGMGAEAARTTLVPRYTDLLSQAMVWMGWKAEEFLAFRCRVEYPMLSSRIKMTFAC